MNVKIEVGTVYPEMGEIDVDGDKVRSTHIGMKLGGPVTLKDMEDDTLVYNIDILMGNAIEVTSGKTGRRWVLSAKDALKLAITQGIDDTEPIVNPAKKIEKTPKRKRNKLRSRNTK